jgi:hypothetical protein
MGSLCGLMLLQAFPAFAGDIDLGLHQRDEQLAVEIRNVSHGIVAINHDMSAAPLLGQLSFRITRGTEELSLQGHLNADLPTAKSYVALLPGQYFGGVFDLDLVEKLYGMKAGCYSVQVRYSDGKALEFGGYAGTVMSRPLRVCVR